MADSCIANSFPTLKTQNEWIQLWLLGKSAWNDWVKNHPEAHVNFHNADFNDYRNRKTGNIISFSGFTFPGGHVDFTGCQFGDGIVDFRPARFGPGRVCFDYVDFGDGDLHFGGAQFSEGPVTFSNAKFGDGEVNFRKANFCDGDVNFNGANFASSFVDFHEACFGKGRIRFNRVFSKAQQFVFTPSELKKTHRLKFNHASFSGVFKVTGLKSSAVLDLCHTRLNHPIDLHNVTMGFHKDPESILIARAKHKEDAASFRRLKKHAKDSQDHERALEFYAQEKRADYGHDITGVRLALYLLYDVLSNYGRSIWRPLVALLLCTLLFALGYQSISETMPSYSDALVYSTSNTVPFYAGSRKAREDGLQKLFGTEVTSKGHVLPKSFHTLTLIQAFVSGVLIFLIILALRNMFRS